MNPSGCPWRLLLRNVTRFQNLQHVKNRGDCWTRLPSQHWRSIAAVAPSPVSKYWTLHELVCSNRYQEAMQVWEDEKSQGQLNPDLYSVVMAMCEKLASGEAAIAVRKDMTDHGWTMDNKCSLHYISALLADGMSDQAFKYVEECTTLLEDDSFVTRAAASFYKKGLFEIAYKVCQLYKGHSQSILAVQLEVLGSMEQVETMEELIKKHHTELNEAPLQVQVAFANGLSLAGHCHRAMDILTSIRNISVDVLQPRSVALLLEAAMRAGDFTMAAKIHSLFWKQCCAWKETNLSNTFLESSESARTNERSCYILRAINATIHLQALTLKNQHCSVKNVSKLGSERAAIGELVIGGTKKGSDVDKGGFHGDVVAKEVEEFCEHDFYTTLRNECVLPDCHTYESLLLMTCFDEEATKVADRAIRTCFQAGSPLTSHSFTGWTSHCGHLSPSQAIRVLSLIKRHSVARYGIPLDATDCKKLLGVELICGNNPRTKKEAVDYIRTIKNIMHRQSLLSDIENWNSLLSAVGKVGDSGPLFTTYNDMVDQNIQPDLNTYKMIVSAAVVDGTKRNTLTAAFDWWRSFIREYPRVRPDIELINMLIDCCRLCVEYERGFFFFGLLQDYDLQPNMDTFEALFKICEITEDRERLETLVPLAKSILPNHTHIISTTVSEIELKWRAKENTKLAKTILSSMEPPVGVE